MPKRVGWMFVGVYCAAVALIVAFVLSPYAGHMSPLLIPAAALPWSGIGYWLHGGSGADIAILPGLVLNAVAAYWLGYGIALAFRRS